MQEVDAVRTINGTYGEVWIDDDYYAEIEEASAKDTLTYADVKKAGQLRKDRKLIEIDGKITIKGHHVRTNIEKAFADAVDNGKTPNVKIIIKLADPDAFGAERCAFYGCKPDDITYFDFKHGSIAEDSMNFSYTKREYLDHIEA